MSTVLHDRCGRLFSSDIYKEPITPSTPLNMRHLALLLILGTVVASVSQAQNIAINSTGAAPVASAMLDVTSTTSGILIPRMTAAQRTAIASPATGLLVFQTNASSPIPANQFWYYDGAAWRTLFSDRVGWSIWGNAGTTVATNFLGTTDNVGFRIRTNNAERFEFTNNGRLRSFDNGTAALPTYSWNGASAQNTGMFYPAASTLGFSSAGVERIRVGSTGWMTINRTAPFAGDVFSVFANGTGGTNNAVGTNAINGYGNTGNGVYAESGTAEGVYGISATGDGTWGVSLGTANGTAGLVGFTTSATGGTYGAWLESGSRNGRGAMGLSNSLGGAVPNGTNAIGLQGQVNGTLGATGQGIAVIGITAPTMTTGDANGVWGQSSSRAGTGVVGIANSTTTGGNPVGVMGVAANATGFGAQVANQHANGTGVLIAGNNATGNYLATGSGGAFTGTTTGGYGKATNTSTGVGLVAVGNNGMPVVPAQGSGIAGTGTRYGVVGYATTTVNTDEANNEAANGTSASAGGYFEVQNGATPQTWAYVGVRDNTSTLRKIIGPGTVNTIVKDLDDNLVALSAPEAPENLFQDYGQGQLENGRARIELDPILAKNIVVNDKHPLRVFIQLEGDCNGVFVTNKTGNGFEVVELQDGSSNTPFMWSVVANRADEVLPDGSISRYAAERFPLAPGPLEKIALETRDAVTPTKELIRDTEAVPSKLDRVRTPKLSLKQSGGE